MTTIEQRLVEVQNRPSGFDYLRIVLAIGVILAHSFLLPTGPIGEGGNWYFYFAPLIVPMFFALSGFLIAGSFERSKSLFVFFGLRVFRIAPALSVEVLISALILGPLLTDYSFAKYVSAPEFHAYFLNILGEIHYVLPGVFLHNPNHLVNGQLWTVPYELGCYVALGVIAVLNVYRRKWLLLAMFVFLQSLQILNTIFRFNHSYNGAGGTTIVLCFLAGLVLFRYRKNIPYSGALALVCLVLSVACGVLPNTIRFVALPAAYLTTYLGLLNPARSKILLSGDYSYGLYLYGYPLQQAIVQLFPALRTWYWNFGLATTAAGFIAFCSWHLIEKPVLSRKNVLQVMDDAIGNLWRQMRRAPPSPTLGDL